MQGAKERVREGTKDQQEKERETQGYRELKLPITTMR